jgi:hypothetical protein
MPASGQRQTVEKLSGQVAPSAARRLYMYMYMYMYMSRRFMSYGLPAA